MKDIMVNQKEACKHREICGGCAYQDIDYKDQLIEKDKIIRAIFEKHSINMDIYEGLIPAKIIYGYRNKMEYTFGDMEKGGELTLGMHKKKHFMSIVTTSECQIVPNDFNKILTATLKFCRENNYKFYHKKTHEGLLRNLIIRHGVNTKEILVNIVTSSEEGFDEEGFKLLIKNLTLENKLVGIIRTFNDSLADAVINQGYRILYGRDYYIEKILGLKFKIRPFSFFQTNIKAIERFYSDVLDILPDMNDDIVYDLYSGTGIISQLISKKCKEVFGVELVEDAVKDAIENANENQISNCHFIAGDVLKELDKLDKKPDMIACDPPRAGIHNKAVEKIALFGIDKILYISCNPKTLGINLEQFREFGYEPTLIRCYDNFPFTKHVETVCLTSRKDK